MRPRIAPPPGPRRFNTPLDEAVHDYEVAVGALPYVDPVVTEAVRLRVATVHGCRRCRAVRFESAVDAGFDEATAAGVEDYENAGLPDHVVVALRLVDAMVISPTAIDGDLRSDLARHFTPRQVAQLLLTIVRFSVNKALVALRIDAPLEEGTTVLAVDADGAPVVVGAVHARPEKDD